MRIPITGVALLGSTLLLLAAPAGAAEAPSAKADAPSVKTGTTLDNLLTAFRGESNAHARYVAFAKKADEDGFHQAARLFRAAARAEEIHANGHADAIKSLGGKATVEIQPVQPKSMKENLEAAIAGESYERDVMYPAFLAQARKEGNTTAARTLGYAQAAEAEHAKLFAEVLAKLDSMKAAAGPYFVCSACGFTAKELPTRCPAGHPKERFERVE